MNTDALPPNLDPPNPRMARAHMDDLKRLSPGTVDAVEQKGLLDVLLFLLGSGSYLGGRLSANPEWVEEFLLTPGGLDLPDYHLIFGNVEEDDEDKALRTIRAAKVREHLRIGVKDLLWQVPIEEILAELSGLADAVVQAMLKVAYRRCLRIYGEPMDEDGTPVPFSVIGLGKLGGCELNYHSDIDLIYLYGTEKGETTGPRRVKNHQFFVRLCELLTGHLSAVTEEGPCYKVDLRLRPEGTKGEIVLPLLSYELYYESFGREWERAMLVKARHVAGDRGLTSQFVEALRPFVYRRYLDSTVIESMREMKMRIDAEMCKKGSHLDVKLGRGGIREIEFVVNAVQLLNGGKRPELRTQGTLNALKVIRDLGLLPDGECQLLREAYLFLRRLENRLQMVNCIQTHRMPSSEEERAGIARMMGEFSSLEDFDRAFQNHTDNVFQVYHQFFNPQGEEEVCSILSIEGLESDLKRKGFSQIQESAAVVTRLFIAPPVQLHRELAVSLARGVVDLASSTPDPDAALEGLERLSQAWSESINAFYSLLEENKGLVELLLRIFGTSRYLTNLLVLNPGIMDYLEEPGFVDSLPSLEELVDEIDYLFSMEGAQTLEERAEVLREAILREILRVGIGHLFHQKEVEWVTGGWTVLAEAVLSSLMGSMVEEGILTQPVGVIGLGKLGSRELIYHSDLDLMFVTADDPSPDTQREMARLVKILGEQTYRGRLFEVDLRLRPYGEQGMMVTSLKTLELYLKRHAQLWEFQALTRARGAAGDGEICSEALEIIHGAIYRESPPEDMAKRVAEMRLRMEKELTKGSEYHLKYSPGGLVDVEFLVQYLRLLHGNRFSELRESYQTIDILHRLYSLNLLTEEHHADLVRGYRFLRVAEMWLRILFDLPVSKLPDQSQRQRVLARAMEYSDERGLLDDYSLNTRRIREIFKEVLGVQ